MVRAGELDLEPVVAERLGVGELRLGRGAECRPRLPGLPLSAASALPRPPRLVRDAAEREPHVLDHAVLDLERGGDRDQREGVARPVAHLAVGGMRRERQRRQLDRGDQLARLEHRLDVRVGRRAGGADRSAARALAAGAAEVDDRVERRERHAHVRRVGGDAGRRGAEDRVDAVEAVDRVAALARAALVAARTFVVVEIGAAGALEEVAADRRHVADLRRGAGQDRAGQHRVALAHGAVLGDRACSSRAAPISRPPSSRSSIAPDRPVTSTSAVGRSIVSRIRSTRLVPPPRNLAPGVAASASASAASRRARIGERGHCAGSSMARRPARRGRSRRLR